MAANSMLKEYHVIISGAGSGIGAATAQRMDSRGAKVTLLGRTESALQEQVEKLQNAQYFVCDVTKETEVEKAFNRCTEKFGSVSILVNSAGAASSAPWHKTTLKQFRSLVEVNLFGAFLCSRTALSQMADAGWGRIINIASTAGLRGYPYVSAYCASKHGVVGLTRSLALEVAHKGITVNAVCPGYTETEIVATSIRTIMDKTGRDEQQARASLTQVNPQGRFVQPCEVAAAVCSLCSPDMGAVNGQSLSVSGGEVM